VGLARRSIRAWLAFAVVATTLATSDHVSAASDFHSVPASRIVATLRAGHPVFESRAEVRGPLRLPRLVKAPLVLRNSRFLGAVSGISSEFNNVVDLSGSEFRRGVNLSGARFERSLILTNATTAVNYPTDFARSLFGESADFRSTMFQGNVSFEGAAFDRSANFAQAIFGSQVGFRSVEFRSAVDFSGAQLRLARFDHARFAHEADFISTRFGPDRLHRGIAPPCSNAVPVWTTFCGARFDAGAIFLGALFQGVTFSLARAAGDLDFDAAHFVGDRTCSTGRADFSTTRFLGRVTFRGAQIQCVANFDQSVVRTLDLTGAKLRTLWLPEQSEVPRLGELGAIGALHLEVDDVQKVETANPSESRSARIRTLELVEVSARAADDLETANDARIERLSLIRDSKPLIPRFADWLFWWGLLGYLVQPLHQAVAIGVAFLLSVLVRVSLSAAPELGPAGKQRFVALTADTEGRRIVSLREIRERLGQLWRHIEDTLGVVFRLRPPEAGRGLVEYLVFKFLIVVLIVNVGNVWPPFRELVEGVV
jgi:uncharacterized protein YjbI with pentapeptide repeats